MLGKRNYNVILDRFVHSAEFVLGEPGLQEATSDFDRVINSKRRSSCINNFRELVTILQKRGHIGEHSIEPLRQISKKFSDPELDGLMDNHEEVLQNYRRQFFNAYSQPNITQPTPINIHGEAATSPSLLSYQSSLFRPDVGGSREEQLLPDDVVDIICTDIGRQWMELARKLEIREGEIDSINNKYPSDLKEKAREVLRLFMSRTDPQKLQIKLLDGLVQARRRDLKESVEELLSRRRWR